MVRKMDFAALDDAVGEAKNDRLNRWSRREPNPTVQMSIRMPVETYDRFRALCLNERYTNGEMLTVLMEGYFERQPKK